MLRTIVDTLTQAFWNAWTYLKDIVAPSLVREMSKKEYAFLRRVNTILAVSNSVCLIVMAGAGMVSSVVLLAIGLAVALSFLQYFLEGEAGAVAGLAN